MSELEKWSDREHFEIRQYERMQDILVAYSMMSIKGMSVICGGGLVAIGAAFVNFISLKNAINQKALSLMKESLAIGFERFAYGLCLILIGLVVVYFSRYCFTVSCQINEYPEKVLKRHAIYGHILEFSAILIYFGVFIYIVLALSGLSAAFYNFPT